MPVYVRKEKLADGATKRGVLWSVAPIKTFGDEGVN